MHKYIIAPLIALSMIAFAGCSMPEEPDSYSEQGQTNKEATSSSSSSKKDTAAAKPQWIGHMDEVKIGMSQSEVKSILGKPDDTSSFESESMGDYNTDTGEFDEGSPTVMDNWTYGDMFSDTDGDDIWSLSFTDGKLDAKSRM